MTSSNINLLEFSEDDFYDLSKDTLLICKLFKKYNKELKKIKQENESLILQLSESHVLIDSLKSENTMLFDTVDALKNKLKESEDLLEKFSSNNLKSMLCIHTDIFNKPDLIVNDLSTSTSPASDSELDSIDIKPVIEDTACLNNSCLTNHVMPNSKESRIQGKFILKCHNCGKIGHIRPNCYLLISHRPWIKQNALRKSEVEDSSSSKYVPPHRRHIKGKGNIVCNNANHTSAEKVKQHSNKISLPPVITATSPVTSDPNVHNSKLRRRRLRGSFLLRPHWVLYLRRDIRFHGISGNNSSLFRRTHQGTTRKSRESPIATMPMKGW
jgi:hypothetical protein